MDEPRSIVVITSCTGLKAIEPGDTPLPAERLYSGEQHRRLMRGVADFRAAETGYELDLWILSAGHGLVRGDERLGFYDSSFAGLGAQEIDRLAASLRVPQRVHEVLSRPYALALLLLGGDYTRAAGLRSSADLGGPTLAFCGAAATRHLAGLPRLTPVPAGKREAVRFRCGLVGLKGELAGRLLSSLAFHPELIGRVGKPGFDVLRLLEDAPRQSLQLAG